MPDHLKYLKRFAISALLCLCVTAMGCGAALVNANSREMALGQKELQASLQTDRQTVTFFVADQSFPLPLANAALDWIRLAPVPVGSLVALGDWIRALLVDG